MKKLVLLIAIIAISVTSIYSKEEKTLEIPKKVLLLAQNSHSTGYTMVSVIDLSNNEIVLLKYGTKLENINRTGMFVDIEKQMKLKNNE